ncbi:LytR/AlgR family response regulator transcription factor [Sphingobacterium sp. MYb382]|uniref:LytR/AlgR family response regulator transcription factor n=1 Tax=Sphingobacterium sp. MYb382 TaxID=2745278 RepID=UPI0030A030F3
MIRCIIIDDEQHAIEVMHSFCDKIPYIQVVGVFTAPTEAAAFININRSNIDLVFLDIEMPRISGIDFLKAYPFPNVIIVTAYTNFALDSYQYGVIDYLLKPFSFDRLCIAIAKVYEKHQKTKVASEKSIEHKNDVIYLKIERNKYIKLDYKDIKYIEGAANFTAVHTKSSLDPIVASRRLKDFEEQLPCDRFKRIHKSYMINMDYFKSLEGNSIKLQATDKKLIISASYRKRFINFLDKSSRI